MTSSALLPTDPVAAVGVAAAGALALGVGPALGRLPLASGRWTIWLLVVAAGLGVERLVAGQPPVVRMGALIGISLALLKALMVLEEGARGMARLGSRPWLGFAAGWPGMDPRPFSVPRGETVPGARALLLRGVVQGTLGLLVLVLARHASATAPGLGSSLSLVGLSLVLHFGVCHLLAGGWQLAGVPCRPLFRAPLRAESLGEFWSRRWNLAFSEMTAIAVYRPLVAPLGRGVALVAAFLFSGLLHELAISVPVRAGYGLPTAYFALHGGLVLAERALAAAGRPVGGVAGRVWTLVWLVAPLPILFHGPFREGIVHPLVGLG